jgi:hypothetical protein
MLEDIGQSSVLENIGFGLATVFGANDESSWHWLLWLQDGTYAYVTGWCDYTGWGCQSGGEIEYYPTLKAAIKAIPSDDDYGGRKPRKTIKGQLTGAIPYGCES